MKNGYKKLVEERKMSLSPSENPDRIETTMFPQEDTPSLVPGATKYDGGKEMAGTLYEDFPRALLKVAELSTFGAQKYSRGGWRYVPNGIERYTDAMHRHLLAEAAGEKIDPESGLLHATHAAWNTLCKLELELGSDDSI